MREYIIAISIVLLGLMVGGMVFFALTLSSNP